MLTRNDYEHGTFTILTSEVDPDDFREDYEDFIAFCEEYNIEQNDDNFYEWCADIIEENYRCDMENIKECDAYNVPVLVTGVLGLWWGESKISPMQFHSVYDAIRSCIECSDADKVCVEFINGVIVAKCAHHDGTNVFTIRALSKKGINRVSTNFKEYDFKRLPYLYNIY